MITDSNAWCFDNMYKALKDIPSTGVYSKVFDLGLTPEYREKAIVGAENRLMADKKFRVMMSGGENAAASTATLKCVMYTGVTLGGDGHILNPVEVYSSRTFTASEMTKGAVLIDTKIENRVVKRYVEFKFIGASTAATSGKVFAEFTSINAA